jgi:carotenoid cleavage dioxygenase-like enzyme
LILAELGCNITPLFDGLIKVDLETGNTLTHEFGPDRLGGEAAFVPRADPIQVPGNGFEEILDRLPSYILDFLPPGASPRPHGAFEGHFVEGEGLGIGAARDEDEGWLVVHVWDEALQQSEVLVIDAKDFEGPPVARVVLPCRVPYGFHGTFVPSKE